MWDLSSSPTQKSTASVFKVVSKFKMASDFGAASLWENLLLFERGLFGFILGGDRLNCVLGQDNGYICQHFKNKLTFHFQPSWRRLHLQWSNQQWQTPFWFFTSVENFLNIRCHAYYLKQRFSTIVQPSSHTGWTEEFWSKTDWLVQMTPLFPAGIWQAKLFAFKNDFVTFVSSRNLAGVVLDVICTVHLIPDAICVHSRKGYIYFISFLFSPRKLGKFCTTWKK